MALFALVRAFGFWSFVYSIDVNNVYCRLQNLLFPDPSSAGVATAWTIAAALFGVSAIACGYLSRAPLYVHVIAVAVGVPAVVSIPPAILAMLQAIEQMLPDIRFA